MQLYSESQRRTTESAVYLLLHSPWLGIRWTAALKWVSCSQLAPFHRSASLLPLHFSTGSFQAAQPSLASSKNRSIPSALHTCQPGTTISRQAALPAAAASISSRQADGTSTSFTLDDVDAGIATDCLAMLVSEGERREGGKQGWGDG